MSEFHAPVFTIERIEPHDNADLLQIVWYENYPCVTRTEEFSIGDKAVYIPVDALVNTQSSPFAFLGDDGKTMVRIKARKLRGVFSMGLVLPISAVLQGVRTDAEALVDVDVNTLKVDFQEYGLTGVVDVRGGDIVIGEDWPPVGTDMVNWLGIQKYEPPVNADTGGDNRRDPGFMPVYTDIDGFRKYPDLFEEGEEVVLTEKIHGCVAWSTWVTMADGSKKRVSSISVGDEVMGTDENGLVVSTRVTRKYDNGKAERWLNIRGTRSGAGQGNSFFSLHCTPEHRFFIPQKGEYVTASRLRVGDTVLVLRSDIGLTPAQDQILLGMMLGDAHFDQREHSASIAWAHKGEHEEYMDWVERGLVGVINPTRDTQTSGYGTTMIRQRTVFSAVIKERFEEWCGPDGDKRVPEWIVESLTPLSLAFWYMDDGSLTHNDGQEDRVSLATCAFSEADCDVLVRGLERLGVGATVTNYDGRRRLRLLATDAERFFLLVAPYIPPSMQYKLPERYRGHSGWLPATERTFRPLLVPQVITSIEDSPVKSLRYDLETETHNYFANDVLTHNSNTRLVYRDGELWVGSHKLVKSPTRFDGNPATNIWWTAAREKGLEEKLAQAPDIVFYGEVYGKVQDLRYGLDNKIDVIFYDAYDITGGRFLNWDEFKILANDLGLAVVPELYSGPWSNDLTALADGKTVLGNGAHVREGFVVKPVQEKWDRRVGRKVLKLIGQDYMLRKGA